MNYINRFFLLEQTEGGWRTWFFWVVMTNIGFFSGLWLGGVLTGSINDKLLQAVVSALIIGGLTGLAQAVVLQRHKISGSGWTLATSLGWGVGIGVSGMILFRLGPGIATTTFSAGFFLRPLLLVQLSASLKPSCWQIVGLGGSGSGI